MKTRDEQAEEYANSMLPCNFDLTERDIEKAFIKGWDAVLKSQWRDASKELPESFERVVVFANGEFVTAEYNEEQSCWFEAMSDESYSFIDQVTHWMPIPDLEFEEEQ